VAATWQTATVLAVRDETPTAKTFRLALSAPTGHRAGQHYVVRLTAPDGYTASRSYSVASAPDDTGEIELTVERLEDGEVSMFLHDVVEVGDELEVRGPIGLYFVWDGTEPAVLLGGGSGVVPLMAMLRLARATGHDDLVHLVVSVRSPENLYYATELPGADATVVYTRRAPPSSTRPAGRLTAVDIEPHLREDATVYVCGSAPFSDAVGDLVVDLGVRAERVKVERFGPSG
jgi:ferredoxin-NADP reductase